MEGQFEKKHQSACWVGKLESVSVDEAGQEKPQRLPGLTVPEGGIELCLD